jgi:hypothetical protein
MGILSVQIMEIIATPNQDTVLDALIMHQYAQIKAILNALL